MGEAPRAFWMYSMMFTHRSDIHVHSDGVEHGEFILAEGLTPAQTRSLADQVPADMLAFYRHFNGGGFGYRGPGDVSGKLDLAPLDPEHFKTYVYGDEPIAIGGSWPVENINDAYYANLVCDPGETTAKGYIAFYGTDPDTVGTFPTFEDYLRAGARRGFVHFWQNESYPPAQRAIDALLAQSAPLTSLDVLTSDLVTMWGITGADAGQLIAWLEDRARLLLPKDGIADKAAQNVRTYIADYDAAQ